jgi:adenylate cyclase
MGDTQVATSAAFRQLRDAQADLLNAYRRQDWPAAHMALSFCRPLAPSLSALYDVYEQRIAEFELSPPPPDWDGVFTAATKQG